MFKICLVLIIIIIIIIIYILRLYILHQFYCKLIDKNVVIFLFLSDIYLVSVFFLFTIYN